MNRPRLDKLRALLPKTRADALLVSGLANIRYLTGFTGSSALLLVTTDDDVLFTDGRYKVQARLEAGPGRVVITRGAMVRAVAGSLRRRRMRRVAFDPGKVSFDFYQALRRGLPGCRLMPIAGTVESLRAVKEPVEIEAIRRAVELNSNVFEATLAELRPGRTEAEIAHGIDQRMWLQGAEKAAFETIVLAGLRAALPHGRPSHNLLRKNELILIDQGAILDGYSSDMTRTVALGQAGRRARGLYRAVLEAQLAAIDTVRAGVPPREVHQAARTVLKKHGLDKAFPHSTGHGVGLEIHEAPRLGPRENKRLEAGMVITIEPGAYVEGLGGVRIEDMVLVTEGGCEVLTPTPKDLRMV